MDFDKAMDYFNPGCSNKVMPLQALLIESAVMNVYSLRFALRVTVVRYQPRFLTCLGMTLLLLGRT